MKTIEQPVSDGGASLARRSETGTIMSISKLSFHSCPRPLGRTCVFTPECMM